MFWNRLFGASNNSPNNIINDEYEQENNPESTMEKIKLRWVEGGIELWLIEIIVHDKTMTDVKVG